ncbi:MAG: inositol monophosphatase family protein [Solirubrobacteraceae bacterium]
MGPVISAHDDLALALELADVADAITLGRFRAADLVVETKPDLTPVSEADRAVEQALRERLAVARPEDRIVGEEYGDSEEPDTGPHPHRRRWIVDPIDGTKGYVRGMSVWATLLALEQDGEMAVGVASAPALGRRWWAARGAGAFTREAPGADPRRLRVSGVRELGDAQLCFGGFEEFRQTGRLDMLLALAEHCWRTRGYGDFWQYMLVAEGAAEIALDPAVSIWDVAAPMVIVQEAGGRFTDFAGVPTAGGGDGIGTNGLVHEAARRIMAS